MKWHDYGYGEAVYASSEGKILGKVFKMFGASEYTSIKGNRPIGDYITFEQAKRAVERSCARS